MNLSLVNRHLSAMMQKKLTEALEKEIDNLLNYLEFALDRETYVKVVNIVANEEKIREYESTFNNQKT